MLYKEITIRGMKFHACEFPLAAKNLLVLRGTKGYIMCGYLDMAAAEKFNDVAVKVVNVACIEDVLAATVCACSSAAAACGIAAGQPIADVLPIIA